MYVALPFKSHSQPAKLMQPTQRAFDDPSIYSQATARGVPRFASTGEMWRRRPDIGIGEVTQITAVRWSPVAAPGKANGARKVASRVHLGRAGSKTCTFPSSIQYSTQEGSARVAN